VKGLIRADTVNKVVQLITNEVQQRQTNFFCLWIDSPGGSPTDSMRVAQLLASPALGRVRTVAYVPKEARADAALIALACDQVVVGPQAVLGGAGAYALGADEVRETTRVIREILSKKKTRSWSLPAAIVDPNLVVYRYTRASIVEYMSEAEAAEQPAADKWQRGDAVTHRGQVFQAVGQEAVEFRLATRTVGDFRQFKAQYGLQNDPALLEPGWADFLIDALASPGLAVLLLVVGFVALYAELHVPGIGIGAFIAAVCFLLFFWSRFLGGTAGWLEVMLFLMGVSCLALEVFVLPGFGVFGLGGGAMVLASLILASQTFVLPHNAYQFAQMQQTLWTIGGAAVGIVAVAFLLRRWLPRAPLFDRMLLEPPSPTEAETISHRETLLDASDLVGARGTTTTPLVPGGKARFGNRVLDVLTEGEAIGRGSEVVVVEVRGNRIVVEPAP
jgi:membrane-bound ClpP family serine protease